MILFTATQGSVLGTVAFIGFWSEMNAVDQSSTQVIAIVVSLVVIVIILAMARAFSSFHLTIQASKNLHDVMTRAVLKARIVSSSASLANNHALTSMQRSHSRSLTRIP